MFIRVRFQKEKYIKSRTTILSVCFVKACDCIPVFSFENLILCLDSDKSLVLCSVDLPDNRRYSSPRGGIFQVNTFTWTEPALY